MRDNEQLDMIVVSESTLISEILGSDTFRVIDYARHYREMSNRTGLDFASAAEAMEKMPLAKEGSAHRALRTRSAKAISADWSRSVAEMNHYVFQLIHKLFHTGDSEVDLVEQLAIPIFNHLYKIWSGLSVEKELGVSQVFCGRMSGCWPIRMASG